MTKEEIDILQRIGALADNIKALPPLFSDHKLPVSDVVFHLNSVQRIIFARQGIRSYKQNALKELFTGLGKKLAGKNANIKITLAPPEKLKAEEITGYRRFRPNQVKGKTKKQLTEMKKRATEKIISGDMVKPAKKRNPHKATGKKANAVLNSDFINPKELAKVTGNKRNPVSNKGKTNILVVGQKVGKKKSYAKAMHELLKATPKKVVKPKRSK